MKVLGIQCIHDSAVAVSVDGEIKVVLELERMTGERYYPSPSSRKEFTRVWTQALDKVTTFTGIHHFDICVSNFVGREQMKIFKTLIKADKWVEVDHHLCHAAEGFYDSPFNSALIISTDGGGNLTAFEVFTATRKTGVKSVNKYPYNYAMLYMAICAMCPEVTGEGYLTKGDSDYLPGGGPIDYYWSDDYPRAVALPGKGMGYSALGKIRREWFGAMREVYRQMVMSKAWFYTIGSRLELEDFPIKDKTIQRDLIATSQYWFSKGHCDEIATQLDAYYGNLDNPPLDGIVISGGCGMNVCMNQHVVEKFGLPVFVSCAAGDPGIPVGACWLIEPPRKSATVPLMYIGMPLFDHDSIDLMAKARGARKINVSEVADLLMKDYVVGVVRGRAEFGPRALGHRSLLAYPGKKEQLEKVNKLKRRQFYRPACPSVTEESALKIFKGRKDSDRVLSHEGGLDLYERDDRFCGRVPPNEDTCQFPDETDKSNFIARSPCMTFAPTMKDECRSMFPATCHFDNTARLQTVSKDSEPWFYALLQEIGKRNGGYEILINTSFNIKGKPILNELRTALEILDNESEGILEHVVCEDWLFTPKKN